MKYFVFIISFSLLINLASYSQQKEDNGVRILFHGIVMDAKTLLPVPNSQVLINHEFSSVSSTDGSFAFFVNKRDSVAFKHLGYKPALLSISDTLVGKEFIAGVYMQSDTVEIGEVIIIPRFVNLKSVIINSPTKVSTQMENAKYNIAISGYTGRTTTGNMGDPATNYSVMRERWKTNAYEKGGIPSDQIAGLNPLLLIPAAYLLIKGAPEKPEPFKNKLTQREIEQMNKLYLESLNKGK